MIAYNYFIHLEITVDEAVRLQLAEWVIVLLSLPDPPPPNVGVIQELAALEVIDAATQFLGEGQVREGIQTTLTPDASTRREQLHEQLNTKAGVPQGGVGLGGLTEWDLLAMILAGRRKGKLPRVQE